MSKNSTRNLIIHSSMVAHVHQAATGQSVADFKEDIVTSFCSKVPKYQIFPWTKSNRPSAISLWNKFGPVCYIADNELVYFILDGEQSKKNKVTFVGCHICKTLYAYNSNIGTTSINNHSCPVASVAPGGSHSMINFAKPLCKPNAGQKQLVTKKLGEMCALDIRPFSIVAGKGFRAVLQTVLDIGVASKNPMSIDGVLQDQVTVKRSLKKRCNFSKVLLLSKVQYHFSCGLWAGFTLDIWTDDNHQISYLSVTILFIDDSWQLHDRTLQVNEFTARSHTGQAILSEFNSVIDPYRSFEVNDITKKASNEQVIVVTDSASNNHSEDGLPRIYKWIPCSDHKIGTVTTTVLAKRTQVVDGNTSAPFYEFYDDAPEIFDLITQCKELVRYFKKTDLNSLLCPKLKQEIVTRLYGLLTMLESIRIQFKKYRELLVKKGGQKEKKIDCIDRELLIEIVRFLVLFKTATLALEPFKTPTLHLVAYWRNRLLKHCVEITDTEDITEADGMTQTIPADSKHLVSIKTLITKQILDKWSLSRLHVMAALLDPRQKSRLHLMAVEEEQIADAKIEIKRLTEHFVGLVKAAADNCRAPSSSSQPSRPPKRAKLIVQQSSASTSLASDSDEDEDDGPTLIDKELIVSKELSEYYALKLSRSEKNDLESGPAKLNIW